MGIFSYVYVEIKSRAILEKKGEKQWKWELQQEIQWYNDPRMKQESHINITHHM